MNKKKRMIYAAAGLLVVLVISLFTMTIETKGKRDAQVNQSETALEASSYPLMEKDWAVNYHVKKHRIFIENIIPRFSFQGSLTKTPGNKDGYIAVFVNGKWRMNANQSMFILEKMNQGKQKITLQLKKKDGTDYGIKKNIVVHIR